MWNPDYRKVFPFPGPADWHPDAWTGRKAVEEIGRLCEKVTDKAVHYLPHKDLNEFLQERVRSGWMSVRQKAKTREG